MNNDSGDFTAFKSQADIDSAVSAAMVGTATSSQVLSGYTFTNSSTSGLSGSMINRGAVTYTLTSNGSYTIPAGYHNGSGKVTANIKSTNTKVGTTTLSNSSSVTVNLGFKPKYLCVYIASNSSSLWHTVYVYDERFSTTKYQRANESTGMMSYDLGTDITNNMASINSDGFTMCKINTGKTYCAYFAVGT